MKRIKMCLCDYCIQAIKSHGERVLVGDPSGYGICDWCGDEYLEEDGEQLKEVNF